MTDDTQNSPAFQEVISPTEHMQRAAYFTKLSFMTNDMGLKLELVDLASKHSRLAEDGQ